MKPYRNLWAAGCLATGLLVMASCKKSGSETGNSAADETYVATTYPKGTPQGTATQKMIGPQGGTLASPDGRISLTIPAGTVTANTSFSVQQVSNTVPLGAGPSYRLLPENTTFSKPVTITLQYDEASLTGRDENALDIVYQDHTGTWRALHTTTRDKTKRTLTVQSTHFSDYSITGYYVLVPQKTTLAEGDTTLLLVKRVVVPDNDDSNGETPLGQSGQYTQESGFGDWGQTGTGSINSSETVSAVYTVPASVSGSSVVDVKVKLKNVKRPTGLPNKELYLQTKLYIAKGDFFAGYYDGQPFNAIGVSVLTSSISTIQGVMADGKSVVILIRGAADVGNFPFGTGNGTSVLRANLTTDVYESVYGICNEAKTYYSDGGISIKSFENGGTIAGDFSTTLYDDSNCQLKTKMISGSFRAKK